MNSTSIPVTINTADFTRKIYVKSKEESDFWKQVGKYILKVKTLPDTMQIEAKVDGKIRSAQLYLQQRGNVALPDGTLVPSLHIGSAVNNIPLGNTLGYKELELRCINTKGNNYKKYYLEPKPDGIYGRYGSIDVPKDQCRVIRTPYERWLFWPLYYEKLSKGYKDVTDITSAGNVTAVNSVKTNSATNANERLYAQLYEYAHGVVKQTLASDTVTQAQVDRAKEICSRMERCRKVETFNRCLEELMLLSPRKRDWKTDRIGKYLAKTKNDFPSILQFEKNLIMAMEGVAMSAKAGSATSFKDYGIHFWEATAVQKQQVMDLLEPSIRSKVRKIYRIKPTAKEKALSAYCKKYGVKQKKLLFHGSVNGNMLSLIKNGPDLTRRAANGRMFGNGFYLAPSSHKSWNYTSCNGTSWARGSSNTGFLLVYACGYGNPYKPTSSGSYTQNFLLSRGYHCVHAEAARTGLRADEIIFYDPDAVCLNYVIELAA